MACFVSPALNRLNKIPMEQTIDILLIEDDQDDIELMEDALASNGIDFRLHSIRDGSEVAGWLAACEALPDVILMDFNLPKVHGRDILKGIRSAPGFENVPVIVLTTSSSPEDRDYSYEQGANRYLTKPVTTEGFKEIVGIIREESQGKNSKFKSEN